jgi:pentose-5-phosphate-3-epimerase
VNDNLATMAEMQRVLQDDLKKFDEYEKKFDEYKKEIELNKEDLAKIKEDAVDLYISGASMYTTRQDIAAFIKNNLNQKYKNK